MKNTWLPVLLVMLFLLACSNEGEKSTASTDSTQTDSSSSVVGDEISDPDEMINKEVQEYLRNFVSDFESTKVSLPSVEYRETMEYDGRTNVYYFQDGKLAYISLENSAEGGFQEILLIRKEEGGDVILKTSTDGGASFTCMDKGIKSGFLVTSRNEPLITGVTEPYQDDYSTMIVQQFKGIQENKENFKLKDGQYEFYLERKKVDSDYGKVEISKVYRINEKLFRLDLLKMVAKDLPDQDLIKIVKGTWYPLYVNKTGYERQTLCGHESKLIIGEQEGKTTWYEQGLQDAWQGVIVRIQEMGNNTYEVELSSQSNSSKRTLVLDDSKNILFINERPYTYSPDRYSVVDSGSDCEEGY